MVRTGFIDVLLGTTAKPPDTIITTPTSNIFTTEKEHIQNAESIETGSIAYQSTFQSTRTFPNNEEVEQRDNTSTELAPPADPECDFDHNPTELFSLIHVKKWKAASARAKSVPEETRIWVSRGDDKGKLRWRLLPIHAAIIFDAPQSMIELLLDINPNGPRSKDDRGMLPLHMAIDRSTVDVIKLLLASYPESEQARDRDGRTPLDLAETSNSPHSEAIVALLTKEQPLPGVEQRSGSMKVISNNEEVEVEPIVQEVVSENETMNLVVEDSETLRIEYETLKTRTEVEKMDLKGKISDLENEVQNLKLLADSAKIQSEKRKETAKDPSVEDTEKRFHSEMKEVRNQHRKEFMSYQKQTEKEKDELKLKVSKLAQELDNSKVTNLPQGQDSFVIINRLGFLEDRVSESASREKALQSKIVELKNAVKEATDSKSSAEEAFQEQISKLQTEKKEKEDQISKLESDISAETKKVDHNKEVVRELKVVLFRAEEERSEALDEVKTLKGKLQVDSDELQKKVVELEESLKKSKEELDEKDSKLTSMKESSEEAKKKAEESIKNIEAESAKNKEEADKFKSESEQLRQEVFKLTETVKGEGEKFSDILQKSEEEKEEAFNIIKSLRETEKRGDSTVTELHSKVFTLGRDLDASRNEVEANTREINKLKDQLQSERAESRRTIEALKALNASASRSHSNNNNTDNTMSPEEDSNNDDNNKLAKKASRMKAGLFETAQSAVDYISHIDSIEKEKMDLAAYLEALVYKLNNSDNDDSELDLDASVSEIQTMMNGNSSSTKITKEIGSTVPTDSSGTLEAFSSARPEESIPKPEDDDDDSDDILKSYLSPSTISRIAEETTTNLSFDNSEPRWRKALKISEAASRIEEEMAEKSRYTISASATSDTNDTSVKNDIENIHTFGSEVEEKNSTAFDMKSMPFEKDDGTDVSDVIQHGESDAEKFLNSVLERIAVKVESLTKDKVDVKLEGGKLDIQTFSVNDDYDLDAESDEGKD